MTWELLVAVAVPVLLGAVAWGDMRAQIASNRERQDERHFENRATLDSISKDVRRINGDVTLHTGQLQDHADEIDRLRRKR